MSVFNEADEEALENELNKGALWAIVYGDMMSFLFLFFLIQFVFTATKDLSQQFSNKAVEEQFGSKKKTTDEIFNKNGIQQIAKVEVQQDKIKLTFLAPILFDEGYADVKAASIPHLTRLAETLKDLPNPILIEGHTDNVPMGKRLQKETGYKSNWELSAARAINIAKFLIDEGLPAHRVAAIGYGEFRPIAQNDTPDGRAANRRIEVNIMRQENF